jgi:excisionase family DNA binding protein
MARVRLLEEAREAPMNRQPDDRRSPGEEPGGFDPEAIDRMAAQITVGLGDIRAAIEDIRRILADRQKSHLTVEEFADQTGRASYTVREWIKDGRIAAIRIAGTGPKGRLLIPREELQKLVASALGGRIPAAATD